MATLNSIAWVQSNIEGENAPRFRLEFSEPVSGLTASAWTVSGDKTLVFISSAIANTDFEFRVSAITVDGHSGFFRVQLPANSLTPALTSGDIDYMFGWNPDGSTWSSATADAPVIPALSVTASDTDIFTTETATLTFRATGDLTHFTADDVVLSAGTKGAWTQVSLREWTLVIVPPSSGDGQIDVSVEEDVAGPGNNAVALRINYVGRLTISLALSESIVTVGETFLATFRLSEDISLFPVDAVTATEGVSVEAANTPNDRVWRLRITAPATGSGQGVISLPADSILPGHDDVTATFEYLDAIDADMSLSAASVQNGGTILARLDFDYGVPNFSSDLLDIGALPELLAINGNVLAINGSVLGAISGSRSGRIGEAIPLGDDNRSWQVPITVPESGEGDLEIELPEDAIGFAQAAAMAQVQFASVINLNIHLNADQKFLVVINQDWSSPAIKITGNNIRSVDVQGLLRPFYYQWNPTTGTLFIKGRPESYYKDLEFEIIVTDADSTTRASGSIDVIDMTPVIRVPDAPLKLVKGLVFEGIVRIDNRPSGVEVKGTWQGLDHKIVDAGVQIFGTLPDVNPGVGSGFFDIAAENRANMGNPVSAQVSWELVSEPGRFSVKITDLYLVDNLIQDTTYDSDKDELITIGNSVYNAAYSETPFTWWYRYSSAGEYTNFVDFEAQRKSLQLVRGQPVIGSQPKIFYNSRLLEFVVFDHYSQTGFTTNWNPYRFSSSGKHLGALGKLSGQTYPISVAFDSDNNRVLLTYSSNRYSINVLEIWNAGIASRLASFGNGAMRLQRHSILNVAYNSTDNQIIILHRHDGAGGDNTVYISAYTVSSDLSTITNGTRIALSGISNPRHLAYNTISDNYWVTTQNQIYTVSKTGTVSTDIKNAAVGGLNTAEDITYDSSSDEYLILDRTNRRWQRYNSDFKFQGIYSFDSRQFGGQTFANFHIIFDSQNDEILSIYGNYWYRYSISGSYLGRVRVGIDINYDMSCFDPVNNEILILDTRRRRWYRFSTSGSNLGNHALNSGVPIPIRMAYSTDFNRLILVDILGYSLYKLDGTYDKRVLFKGVPSEFTSFAGVEIERSTNVLLVLVDNIKQKRIYRVSLG